MLSSRFAGIPISSSTIDGPGLPQLANRGEQTTRAVTGSGGRLHFGMVAGIKSERWPTSNRNLEGYVRSLARRLRHREWRPHISRIERSRGTVRRYGESAQELSGLTARVCPRVRREETVERLGGAAARIRTRFGGPAGRWSRPKRSGDGKKPHRRRLERRVRAGEDGRLRSG